MLEQQCVYSQGDAVEIRNDSNFGARMIGKIAKVGENNSDFEYTLYLFPKQTQQGALPYHHSLFELICTEKVLRARFSEVLRKVEIVSLLEFLKRKQVLDRSDTERRICAQQAQKRAPKTTEEDCKELLSLRDLKMQQQIVNSAIPINLYFCRQSYSLAQQSYQSNQIEQYRCCMCSQIVANADSNIDLDHIKACGKCGNTYAHAECLNARSSCRVCKQLFSEQSAIDGRKSNKQGKSSRIRKRPDIIFSDEEEEAEQNKLPSVACEARKCLDRGQARQNKKLCLSIDQQQSEQRVVKQLEQLINYFHSGRPINIEYVHSILQEEGVLQALSKCENPRALALKGYCHERHEVGNSYFTHSYEKANSYYERACARSDAEATDFFLMARFMQVEAYAPRNLAQQRAFLQRTLALNPQHCEAQHMQASLIIEELQAVRSQRHYSREAHTKQQARVLVEELRTRATACLKSAADLGHRYAAWQLRAGITKVIGNLYVERSDRRRIEVCAREALEYGNMRELYNMACLGLQLCSDHDEEEVQQEAHKVIEQQKVGQEDEQEDEEEEEKGFITEEQREATNFRTEFFYGQNQQIVQEGIENDITQDRQILRRTYTEQQQRGSVVRRTSKRSKRAPKESQDYVRQDQNRRSSSPKRRSDLWIELLTESSRRGFCAADLKLLCVYRARKECSPQHRVVMKRVRTQASRGHLEAQLCLLRLKVHAEEGLRAKKQQTNYFKLRSSKNLLNAQDYRSLTEAAEKQGCYQSSLLVLEHVWGNRSNRHEWEAHKDVFQRHLELLATRNIHWHFQGRPSANESGRQYACDTNNLARLLFGATTDNLLNDSSTLRPNRELSLYYFREAAEYGSADAKKRLRQLLETYCSGTIPNSVTIQNLKTQRELRFKQNAQIAQILSKKKDSDSTSAHTYLRTVQWLQVLQQAYKYGAPEGGTPPQQPGAGRHAGFVNIGGPEGLRRVIFQLVMTLFNEPLGGDGPGTGAHDFGLIELTQGESEPLVQPDNLSNNDEDDINFQQFLWHQ